METNYPNYLTDIYGTYKKLCILNLKGLKYQIYR